VTLLLQVFPTTRLAAQIRYLPDGASGIALTGSWGPHLGSTLLGGALSFGLRDRLQLSLRGGTGRIEDSLGLYEGEDPRLTVYGPRLSLHVAPPPGRTWGMLLTVGYEWERYTHPVIAADGGELNARGTLFGATAYRIVHEGGTTDVYFDASYTYHDRMVTGTSIAGPIEASDPTGILHFGAAVALKTGPANTRRTVVRPWMSRVEGDLGFGLSVSLVVPVGSGRLP
jgi:hypothetical protein